MQKSILPIFLRKPILLFLALVAFPGCVPLPLLNRIGAYSNVERTSPSNATNARQSPPLNPEYFIGLTLSGGGSRAANFSGSVLWRLHELGILEGVQYISSVSGGSLPATYYALFRNNKDKWAEAAIRNSMAQSFEGWVLAYLLNPWSLLKFLGTSYDRSDVMAGVFSNRLFGQHIFADLPDGAPRLIIDATNYLDGKPFTFTNDRFDGLRSDLGKLPLAEAVMASAAYPGGFRNVTLKNFAASSPDTDVYLHLFDAGVSDNLGIDALLAIHDAQVEKLGPPAFSKGCLLILIDSYTPYHQEEMQNQPDTRTAWDLIVDTNFLNGFSIFLETKRRRTIDSLGFDRSNLEDAKVDASKNPSELRPISLLKHLKVTQVTPQQNESEQSVTLRRLVQEKRSECRAWHIALTELGLPEAPGFEKLPDLYGRDYARKYGGAFGVPYAQFTKALRSVPTRFQISKPDEEYLHAAADLLVQELNSRRLICQWFQEITGQACHQQ